MDESLLLQYPDLVARGSTPNLDFYTVYGSPSFQFLAAWYHVLGYSLADERAAGLLYRILLVLGIWALASRRSAGVGLAAGLLAVLFLPTDATAYAWIGGLALCIWFLALASSDGSRLNWVVAGVLGGLAVGWRYELILVIALVGLTLGWKHKRSGSLCIGLIVGLAPTIVHLAAAGTEVWSNVVTGRMGTNFQQSSARVPVAVYLGLAVCALGLLALAWRVWVTRSRADLATLIVCLGITPQALQRVDIDHMTFTAVVILPLAFAGVCGQPLLDRLKSRPQLALAGFALVICGLVPIVTALLVGPFTSAPARTVAVDGRRIAIQAEFADDFQATLDDLVRLVPAGSNVFVGTDDMGRTTFNPFPVYYLLSREYNFPGYYQELAAGVAERDGSGLADDLIEADALVLIHFPEETTHSLFPNAPGGYEENNQVVRERFRRASQHRGFALYLQRG